MNAAVKLLVWACSPGPGRGVKRKGGEGMIVSFPTAPSQRTFDVLAQIINPLPNSSGDREAPGRGKARKKRLKKKKTSTLAKGGRGGEDGRCRGRVRNERRY